MKRFSQISAITLATVVAAATPAALLAQAAPEAPATEAPAAPMTQDVSSAELDAFATAYEGVLAINTEYAPQLEQETDPEAQQLLLEEAQIASADVIEQTEGIDVDRYVEILTIAQADPALAAQIVERVEQ